MTKNIQSMLIKTISYVYVTMPFLIFSIGWLKPWIGIPIALAVVLSLWLCIKNDEYSLSVERIVPYICIVTAIALLWVLIAGIGGYSYQNPDHRYRNTIFQTLINSEWPVVGTTYMDGKINVRLLCYYFGYWLPSALVGKLFGYQIGNYFLIFWSVLGIVLVVFWLCHYTKKEDWKVILFVIFFSGLDYFRVKMTGNTTLIGTDQIEYWAGYQYSSNTTLVFWVYNQAIYSWLITTMLLSQKKKSNVVFLWGNLILSSTFSFLGLLPYVVYQLVKGFSFKNWKNEIKEIFTIQNVLGGGCIGLLSVYFITSNTNTAGIQLHSGGSSYVTTLLKLAIFLLFEIGAYVVILYKLEKKNPLFWITLISLVVIPIFSIPDNYANDFCMRVSVPALFVLMTLLLKNVDSYKNKIVFWGIFCIGAVTAVHEFNCNLTNITNYSNITLPKQRLFEASNYTVEYGNNRITTLLKDNKNQYDLNDVDLYNLKGYTDTEYVQTMHGAYQVMIINGEMDIHITEKIENDILFKTECETDTQVEIKINDGEWKKLDSTPQKGVSEIVIPIEELKQELDNVIYLRSSNMQEDLVVKRISIKNI